MNKKKILVDKNNNVCVFMDLAEAKSAQDKFAGIIILLDEIILEFLYKNGYCEKVKKVGDTGKTEIWYNQYIKGGD